MRIEPPFDAPVGKVGSTICFDVGVYLPSCPHCVLLSDAVQLRFPEISIALRRLGADIITYPSAFTVPTGKAHWEILLRARAIETQSYVVAAAQVCARLHVAVYCWVYLLDCFAHANPGRTP